MGLKHTNHIHITPYVVETNNNAVSKSIYPYPVYKDINMTNAPNKHLKTNQQINKQKEKAEKLVLYKIAFGNPLISWMKCQ